MRIVEPPSLDSPGRGRGGDLDGLLSAFFRSELPHPWPRPEVPDEQPSLPLKVTRLGDRARPALRSRFALAASVALILAGSWLLSGGFEELATPGTRKMAPPTGDPMEDSMRPRLRERMIVDPSGQTKFQIEIDLP